MNDRSKFKKTLFYVFVILGMVLRVWGFFYNGNENLISYREIGQNVRTKGLAESFGHGYFPIAFLIFGLNDSLSQLSPEVWWWPYKASNFIFELGLALTLFVYLWRHKWKLLFTYWLNPWFLIPGAWAGFWDAPYTLFIFWAILVLDSKFDLKNKMISAGFLFGFAFSIKPQTFAPLSILALYFLINFVFKRKILPVLQFLFAFTLLPVMFSLYFYISGKPIYFMLKWYAADMKYTMPFLVNSEINIWHTVTRIIMHLKGLTGPIYSLNTYTFPYNILEYFTSLVYIFLIFIIIHLYAKRHTLPKYFFMKIITFSLILLPQIGTRSHAYHFFPASLFLIPLIILEKNEKLIMLWVISVLIHLYNIWWQYGLGPDIRSPIPLWGEPVLSMLGFLQFLATLGFIYIFLRVNKA